ncbi:hypothetical protein AB1Y20_008360 [Prymnesium parvum]|uniref:GRIP domain-containing protein n=1 Tax=Prymnesium parvum TaxID=97485 RepID=A0AB34IS79_PRYPA
MLRALQEAAEAASESGRLRLGTPAASEWFPSAQLLSSREWFPEDRRTSGEDAPHFSISDSVHDFVEEDGEGPVNVGNGGSRPTAPDARAPPEEASRHHARIAALEDEVAQTKLRALRKLREQEATIHELEQQVAALQAERTILRREIFEAQRGAQTPVAVPPPTPAAADAATAGCARDVRRREMLRDKVALQAAELLRERAAHDAASREVERLQRRLHEAQAARQQAEGLAEELQAEIRVASRRTLSPSAGAPTRPAREEAVRVSEEAVRAREERDDAAGIVLRVQEELEEVRRVSAEEVRQARADAAAADAKLLLAAADVKTLKAQLASVRQKAREMLEQKDGEIAALHRRRLHSHAHGGHEGAGAKAEEEAPPGTPRADRTTRGPPSSSGLDELRQYAVLQARLEAEVQRERARSHELQQQLQAAVLERRPVQEHGEDAAYLKNVLLRFLEMGEVDSAPLLQVLATALHFNDEEVARVRAARARRGRFSLTHAGQPRAADAQISSHRCSAPETRSSVDAAARSVGHLGDAGDSNGQVIEQLRNELHEMTRRHTVTEALLHKANEQLEARCRASASGNDLAYLRQVVLGYLCLGDGEESTPLLHVISTILHFDEADIAKIHAVRRHKVASQAGLLGQAAKLFYLQQ